jgi:hypothetical protein
MEEPSTSAKEQPATSMVAPSCPILQAWQVNSERNHHSPRHSREKCSNFHPHFELIVGCKNSPQAYGGAICVSQGATCNIDGAFFVSNTAGDVSQQRKTPSLSRHVTLKNGKDSVVIHILPLTNIH